MSKKLFAAVVLLSLFAPAARAQVTTGLPTAPLNPIWKDATNPQYFDYEGKAVALFGISGEYLPHVRRSQEVNTKCTYGTAADITANGNVYYQKCLDFLAARKLNRTRIWLALNQSPGEDAFGAPFDNEQPFKRLADGRWNLQINVDTDWNNTFFDRVREVVVEAGKRGIVVEVTLFDVWSGERKEAAGQRSSPWYAENNNLGGFGLGERKHFVSYDNVTNDLQEGNKRVRALQIKFIKKIVDKLRDLNNFYWEIANEPDMSGLFMTADGLQSPLVNWHNAMANELRNYEFNTYGKKHLIAVNYSTRFAIDNAAANPNIDIVNSHYVQLRGAAGDQTQANRWGAIRLVRSALASTRILGFNEGRITGIFDPTLYDAATPESVRAEAWEYAINEGANFDHLSYDWFTHTPSKTTRRQLSLIPQMLVTMSPTVPLRNMVKLTNNTGGWASLPAYPTINSGTKYWAAMARNGFYHFLYLHNSTVSSHGFTMYQPQIRSATNKYVDTIPINLGSTSGCFEVNWYDPAGPAVANADALITPAGSLLPGSGNIFWSGANGYQNFTTPGYTFDILLRIRRLTTGTPCP